MSNSPKHTRTSNPLRGEIRGAALKSPEASFSNLTELYSSDFCAPIDIRSRDKTLHPIEQIDRYDPDPPKVPADLARLPEGLFIWNQLFKPSHSAAQILGRQAIIDAVVEHQKLEAIRELKNECYSFVRGVQRVYSNISVGDHQQESALQIYLAGPSGRYGDFYHQAAGVVERGFEEIEQGRAALKKLSILLKESFSPSLQRVGEELYEVVKAIAGITETRIKNDTCKVGFALEKAQHVLNTLRFFGALVEIAGLSRDGLLGKCSFNKEKPAEYKDGWSIALAESKNHRNDSPADSRVTVYSGSNMSGKTESGLKQSFFIQLFAQSFGYSTIKEGNFHLHDDFFYFDRAATDTNQGLSAFGEEVEFYKTHYPTLGESAFGCIDEGFSTTDSEGQYRLLFGVQGIKRLEKGKLFFSNHCEEFNQALVRFPDAAVYHFAVGVKPNGEADFTYKLTPGIADSNSIAVADALKSDPELVGRAKLARDGMLTVSDTPQRPTSPEVVAIPEAERAKLKTDSAKDLFLADPRRESGYGFAQKPDLTAPERLIYLKTQDDQLTEPYIWLETDSGAGNDAEVLFGSTYSGEGSAYNLKRLFLHGPKISPCETHERGRTFEALSANDRYSNIAPLVLEIAQVVDFLPLLSHSATDLLQVNHVLNPIRRSNGHYGPLDPVMAQCERFLTMNERLLADRFPFKEEVARLRALWGDYKRESERLYSLDIDEIARQIDEIRARPISDELLPVFRALVKSAGIPFTFESPVSQGAVFDYIQSLESASRKKALQARYSSECYTLQEAISGCPAKFDATQIRQAFKLFARYEKDPSSWAGVLSLNRIGAVHKELGEQHDHARSASQNYSFLSHIISAWIPLRLTVAFGSDKKAPGTLNELFQVIHGELERFGDEAFLQKLPRITWFEIDATTMEEVIRPLVEQTIASYRDARTFDEYRHEWPSNLRAALLLRMAIRKGSAVEDLAGLCEDYDSVHLCQAANSLRKTFCESTTPSPQLWGWEADNNSDLLSNIASARHYWGKHQSYYRALGEPARIASVEAALMDNNTAPLIQLRAELAAPSPSAIIDRTRTIYEREYRKIFSGIEELERRQQELCAKYPMFETAYEAGEFLERIREAVHGGGGYYNLCESLYSYSKGTLPSLRLILEATESDRERLQENLRQYWKRHGEGSEFVRQAEACNSEYQQLLRDTRDFLASSSIRVNHGGAVTPLNARAIVTHQFNLRMRAFVPDGENRNWHEVWRVAQHIATMGLWGHLIAKNGYGQARFNTEGVLDIDGLTSLLAFRDQKSVPQRVSLDLSKRIDLVNGPNMSGKTYLEKSLLIALGASLQTGFGPYTSGTMPYFDGLYYFDRVTGKIQTNLSSAGTELTNMSALLPRLRSGKLCLLIGDEMFSTMSGKYQGYFTQGLLSEIHDLGQFAIFSTHHHGSVDAMSRLSSSIVPWYLKYEIIDGEIQFYYEPTVGHAPSAAIAVARRQKMPEEILQVAESAP